MENNTNQISQNYCKKNCGFFGNQAFDGYCSKCYKEHVKRQNSGTAAGRVTPTSVSLNSESSSNLAAAAAAVVVPTPTLTETPEAMETATTTVPASTSTSNITFNLPETIEIDNNNDNNNNTPSENNNVQSLAISNNNNNNTLPENASSSSSLSSASDAGERKSKRTRCNVDTCRRKLGLTGFDCRCGGIYCWEHRYSDKHCCQFDYKEMGQEQIRKNNPVVVGEKIQKI